MGETVKPRILVITERQNAQAVFFSSLREQYDLDCFEEEPKAFEKFKNQRFDFTFIDIELLKSGADPSSKTPLKSALKKYWQAFPTASIVILADNANTRSAVKAVKAGADDYLNYPIDKSELALITAQVEEVARAESELEYFRDQFWSIDAKDIIESKNPKMQKVFKLIKSVAPTKSTVLLTGETGVGKSMLAKLIHDHSTRKSAPFIPVHCGAISENLIESELFGHEKGAFTGAIKRKLGKFELANGGTIFLDEIGTISANAQIKMLQVLQDAIFQRVGGETNIKVDVRIIAATNENLKEMVEEKEFRRDLFHRLSVFPIEIPALKERPEDIPGLLDVFLKKLNKENTKEIRGFRPEVIEALCAYDWTGNIREMENLIERAFILEETDLMTPESFPIEIMRDVETTAVVPLDVRKSLAEARNEVVENFERQYLKELLAEKKGKINETAEAAGVGVRQIHKLMSKYGLLRNEYKGDTPSEFTD